MWIEINMIRTPGTMETPGLILNAGCGTGLAPPTTLAATPLPRVPTQRCAPEQRLFRNDPQLPECGPISVELEPKLADSGPMLVDVLAAGANLVEFMVLEFDRLRPTHLAEGPPQVGPAQSPAHGIRNEEAQGGEGEVTGKNCSTACIHLRGAHGARGVQKQVYTSHLRRVLAVRRRGGDARDGARRRQGPAQSPELIPKVFLETADISENRSGSSGRGRSERHNELPAEGHEYLAAAAVLQKSSDARLCKGTWGNGGAWGSTGAQFPTDQHGAQERWACATARPTYTCRRSPCGHRPGSRDSEGGASTKKPAVLRRGPLKQAPEWIIYVSQRRWPVPACPGLHAQARGAGRHDAPPLEKPCLAPTQNEAQGGHLESIVGRPGVNLRSIWGRAVVVLGQFRGLFGVEQGSESTR